MAFESREQAPIIMLIFPWQCLRVCIQCRILGQAGVDVKSELESQNALDDNFIKLDHDGNVEIVPDDEDSPDDCILLCGHGWPGDDELAAIAGADWEAGPEQPRKEDEESDLEAVLEKLRVGGAEASSKAADSRLNVMCSEIL